MNNRLRQRIPRAGFRAGLWALLALILASPLVARGSTEAAPETAPRYAKRNRALEQRTLRQLQRALSEGSPATLAAARALADLGHVEGRRALDDAAGRPSPDPYVLASLVWLGDKPHVARAESALADPRTATGDATFYGVALARQRSAAALERLHAIWDDSGEDPVERLWAAAALYEMGDERPREYLEGLLRDKDAYIAVIAGGALFSQGHPEGRQRLIRELANRRSNHLDQVAFRFGERPDPERLSGLQQALLRARDDHDRVWLAWAVLRTMGYRNPDRIDPAPTDGPLRAED